MRHQQCGCGTELDGEVAIADGVERVVADLVEAEFGGIAYFTNPFIWSDPPPDALETLLVYDTSSTAPPIDLAQRHVVIRTGDAPDGSRRVIELVVLANRGRRTRIAPG